MSRSFFVYILSSGLHGTLYTGMTNDLPRRMFEHREKLKDGFTKRYDVTRLVWFEQHPQALAAIRREKQIKAWRRDWKLRLIDESNPDWSDLYPTLAAQL